MRSFSLLFVAALAACSPFDPDLGGTTYKCGNEEPKCPDGYSCQMVGPDMRCVSDEGPGPDGQTGGFQCQDDSNLETKVGTNNNSTATATPLPGANPLTLGSLAICPEGDRDTYMLQVTIAMSNVEAIAMWESGMPISISILNGGGTTINTGTAMGANANRAYAANLPVGTYNVQTFAASNVKNNYSIKVTTSQ